MWLSWIGMYDEVQAAAQIVEHGDLVAIEQQDVRRTELIGLVPAGLRAQARCRDLANCKPHESDPHDYKGHVIRGDPPCDYDLELIIVYNVAKRRNPAQVRDVCPYAKLGQP